MPRTVQSPTLSRQLGFLLRQGAVRAEAHARAHFPVPYDPREFVVLALLHERGPLFQQRIATIAQINRTVMVRVVNELEGRALVTRTRDSADRRRYALAPTGAGEAALTALWPSLKAAEDGFTAQLPTGDRDRLLTLLRALFPVTADDGIDSLTDFAGYLVYRAHLRLRDHAIAQMRSLRAEPRHFAALTVIADDQPCSQQHVASQLGVTPPAILPLIDELDEQGLVRRARNRADRRAYDLTLTPAGEQRLRASRQVVAGLNRELRDRLGGTRVDELHTLLLKLLGS